MRDFKQLTIWREGMDLVSALYTMTQQLPKQEEYALKQQMQRAAVSIVSNIAEGCSRSPKEMARFLSFSIGSAYELETQLMLCDRLGYFKSLQLIEVLNQIVILQKRMSNYRGKIYDSIK